MRREFKISAVLAHEEIIDLQQLREFLLKQSHRPLDTRGEQKPHNHHTRAIERWIETLEKLKATPYD